jgi:hypothetical protein
MNKDASFDKFKELIQAVEKAKLKYVIIGGFAVDGKRRKLTRPHHDIDIIFLKKDEAKVEKLLKDLHYSLVNKYDDNYKLKASDGTKLDLYLVEVDDEKGISKGKTSTYTFPKEMVATDLEKGTIDGVLFTISGNAMTKRLGLDSANEADHDFCSKMNGDEKKMGKIKRIPRAR